MAETIPAGFGEEAGEMMSLTFGEVAVTLQVALGTW